MQEDNKTPEEPTPEQDSELTRRLYLRRGRRPGHPRRSNRTAYVALIMNAVTLVVVLMVLWGPLQPKPRPPVAKPPATGTPGATLDPRAFAPTTLSVTVERGSPPRPGAARIFVDDVLAGEAPLRDYAIRPGSHRVRIICLVDGKPGAMLDRRIDVQPGTPFAFTHTCP